MKIISKMLVGALAFAVTNVYAAELMTKAEFEKVASQYEKIGDISTSKHPRCVSLSVIIIYRNLCRIKRSRCIRQFSFSAAARTSSG